ncbi:YHS domain-containing protein [candidate division WOR-3 bacterium RBG_13_43_14]|uniref:YHS domain-containing protein n=1 Tax=candidate division WOR-3 bacterium RBG_13_43_14 TaxID=1802590 RepID=A0A1F4UB25_UNCW3|nr:MAG: YHS domain-containing protein [candidate division WOR-3 bacterium RBG_13_43_14]
MAIDPVCMMQVDDKTAEYQSEYKGTKYYFCAPGCKAAFDKNPQKYIEPPIQKGCCCSGGH